jgi:hypothetical protein
MPMHNSPEDASKQAFPRDRDGEIFQDDLGEDHTASPQARDDAAHDVRVDEEVDSQEADEFMKARYGNRPAQRPP